MRHDEHDEHDKYAETDEHIQPDPGGGPDVMVQRPTDAASDQVTADDVPALEDLVLADATDTGALIASSPATKDPTPAVLPERFGHEHQPPGPVENSTASDTADKPASDIQIGSSGTGERPIPEGSEPVTAVEPAGARVTGSPTDTPGEPEFDSPERWSVPGVEELDELTILSRAQDGDLEAFDWLISAYQGGIFRLCLRMLNDRSEAEDIVQETFITAWRSLPKLTVPQAFIPWLYRTATNKCLDELRRRQRRSADPTADLGSDQDEGQAGPSGGRNTIGAGAPLDPAQDYETQSQMRALAEVLQTLPPGPRACWLLREVHEFSYAEIAAIVQVPESTVRGRIARAKRLLAEGMEPWR
ncbi:RNA polymerase sigma factor [Arthrobacter sp. CP30]